MSACQDAQHIVYSISFTHVFVDDIIIWH